MNEKCDRIWELDALREGRLGEKDAVAFERHLKTCADCTQEKIFVEKVRAVAAELPAYEPSELELRRLRTRVLRSAALGDRRAVAHPSRRVAGVVAFAAASAAAAWLAIAHRGAAPTAASTAATSVVGASEPVTPVVVPALAGTVTPANGATWTQTRNGNEEHVTLGEGTLHVHVRHQEPGERFLVDLPDATVEVRGTTFDVEARSGHATRVAVEEGVVVLARRGRADVTLHAGESWMPPRVGVATDKPTVAAASKPSNPATTTPSDDGSSAYADAVAAFQRGDYASAAGGFDAYVTRFPNGGEREDAMYLSAVSLVRAGRADAAARAAEKLLAAYPSSFHAKEASILVARAARDRGDCAKARAVLAPWLGDPGDAEAKATLRSCAP